MEWQEAKESTLQLWRRIRAAIDRGDELELLTEINAICDLCVKAKESAPDPIDRCRYCLAYQQFGGCHEINGQMSLKVAENDWQGLRELVDGFIRQLEAMQLPARQPG